MDGFLVPLPTIRKGLYSKLATLNTFPFGQSDAATAELVEFRLHRISRNSKSKDHCFLYPRLIIVIVVWPAVAWNS